jgi:hypothetical protein
MEPSGGPAAPPEAPVLQGAPAVKYDPLTGGVSVEFTFNMPVQAAGTAGWTLKGDGTAAITAVPGDPVPGAPLTTALTAANREAPDKTATVPPVTVMPVGGVFTRAGAAGEYTVEYIDHNGAAGVRSAAGGLEWYYLPAAEGSLRKTFTAVYSPNAPGTVDRVEQGFAAVPYDEEISRKVLNLFKITVGAAPDDDRIEIRGTGLPAGTDRYHPVVIDAGIPGEDNGGLPAFSVPAGDLGAAGLDYSHIRLRVNRGAYLVIEADNNGYAVSNPCPAGRLKNGTAEVMGGGRLRSGAYKGSPLGENAVTLVRLGSSFATGPETSFDPSQGGYDAEVDKFFSGWLIGPAGENPRIQWGVGDQNGDYFEIRPGKIAFSANITIKKTLVLDAGLWFINGPTITIDAAEDSLTYEGKKGLFAANGTYRFYGTKSQSGGQNIANVMATIVIQSGSSLHGSFLMSPDGKFVTAAGWDMTITNQGDANDAAYTGGAQGGQEIPEVSYDTSRYGYCNWFIPKKDI